MAIELEAERYKLQADLGMVQVAQSNRPSAGRMKDIQVAHRSALVGLLVPNFAKDL